MQRKLATIFGILLATATLTPVVIQFPIPSLVVAVACIIALLVWLLRDHTPAAHEPLAAVDEFSITPDHLVFVYGSLLVRDSLLRTVSAGDCHLECIPAVLSGYRREWGAAIRRIDLIEPDGTPIDTAEKWASLVAVPGDANDELPGAVIGLSDRGLFALKNRELRYNLVEVRSRLRLSAPDARLPDKEVFAFLPKEAETDSATDEEACVRDGYFTGISDALRRLGFEKLPRPDKQPLRRASLVGEETERIARTRSGQRTMLKLHREIVRDLSTKKESRPTAFSLMPIGVTPLQYAEMCEAAESIVRLSTDALRMLSGNDALLEAGRWSAEDKELLSACVERDEARPSIVRVDMVQSGNRLLILEANTDSPGGMRHLDTLSADQSRLASLDGRFSLYDAVNTNLCDAGVDAILAAYRRMHGDDSSPEHALITEYAPRDWATWPEMVFFRDELNRRNVHADILDLKEDDFEYVDGVLRVRGSGTPCDLIYKRVLWEDLGKAEFARSREALRKAYLDKSVCVVNSLGGRLAGAKFVLAVMKSERFGSWLREAGTELLPEDEQFLREHVPSTRIWGDASNAAWPQALDQAAVLDDPTRYVLKSFQGYGGRGIVIGCHHERPQSRFESCWNQGYILQEYVPHGRALVPVVEDGEVKLRYHHLIFGAYVIDGKCLAVEAKSSPSLPINMSAGAFRTSVFPVRKRPTR